MTTDSDRSERVVADFKKRKLAASALARIHEIIQGFEQDRIVDRRMARIGIVIILAVLAIAAYFFFSGEDIIIS